MNGVTADNGVKTSPAALGAGESGNFMGLFCQRFKCARSKFTRRVFLECLHPNGLAAARIIRLVYPRFFQSDFDLIEQIKDATSFAQVQRLVEYHVTKNKPGGFFRLIMKTRVSKHRLLDLARSVFAGTAPDQP